jgi:hypothetical protein
MTTDDLIKLTWFWDKHGFRNKEKIVWVNEQQFEGWDVLLRNSGSGNNGFERLPNSIPEIKVPVLYFNNYAIYIVKY